MKNIFFILIVIVFLVIGFFLITERNIWTSDVQVKNLEINKIQYVKIAGQIIKVDLALTLETQSQGLSGRKDLKEDEGMLFVFSAQGGSASGGEINNRHYFWMKDMNFPIDIIWFGEDLKVVYIEKNAQPVSFPTTFGPEEDSKYVLEVISGFSEKNNLKEGNKVEFLP